MKYVQSFYQYPVTYSSIGKGIPSKDADGELRNITPLEDSELDTLQRCEPMFRDLVNLKKYRILNKLPESYKPSATLINEAQAENARLRAELEALQAQRADGRYTDTPESGTVDTGEPLPPTGDMPPEKPMEPDAPEPSEAAPPAAPETAEKIDLSKMDYKELQEYAAACGVEKVANIKKADLIKAIEDVEALRAAR